MPYNHVCGHHTSGPQFCRTGRQSNRSESFLSILSSPRTTMSHALTPSQTTSILHRTPWKPPTAISAQGIYVDLQDGTRLLDAVGGAAVACIGNGHPHVLQTIKEQVDRVSCTYFSFLSRAVPLFCIDQTSITCSCPTNPLKNWLIS